MEEAKDMIKEERGRCEIQLIKNKNSANCIYKNMPVEQLQEPVQKKKAYTDHGRCGIHSTRIMNLL